MSPPRAPRPVDPEAEASLLARLRTGDAAAFGDLVDRHGASMLRLAQSLVKVAAVAEEVVQDTWMAALDGLSSFEERASLRTWLFSILVNKARSRAVRESRSVPWSALGPEEDGASVDPARFQPDGHWREPPGRWTEEDPERLALGAETRALIEAAIAALPAGQRAVIVLRDVEGLDAGEACRILALSEANQRVLLHRARTRVREALQRHLGSARP